MFSLVWCFSWDRGLYTIATCCQGGVKALPLQWLSAGVHGAGLAGPGQAKGQSLERLSSDHQITPPTATPSPKPQLHTRLWPASRLHTAHRLWNTPPESALPVLPSQTPDIMTHHENSPDCETSRALHHLVTSTLHWLVLLSCKSALRIQILQYNRTDICKQLLRACAYCIQTHKVYVPRRYR